MRIWLDTADLDEIEHWAADDRISGFTTNPTLMRNDNMTVVGLTAINPGGAMAWALDAVEAAAGKPISIDGPAEVWNLGDNVYRKVVVTPPGSPRNRPKINLTAICTVGQLVWKELLPTDVISVFAGRIMDTGRDPRPVIDAARATGAQVLWASVREPYNIVQAEAAGCDIITVPPAILTKWFEWQGLPLETVAARTIAQFDKDREGLW